jgi:hypothetical protein
MSLLHTVAAPGGISRIGILGRATRDLFGVIFRTVSSAVARVATSGREVPPEVFRFPLF